MDPVGDQSPHAPGTGARTGTSTDALYPGSPDAPRDSSPAEAAAATRLSLDTLRYYEREGLIGPIARDAGGRRRYSADDVAWTGIVTCLREAGLGIDDLRRFTTLLKQSADPTDRVTFLRERRAELEERQRCLQRALDVLDDKIAYYGRSDGPQHG